MELPIEIFVQVAQLPEPAVPGSSSQTWYRFAPETGVQRSRPG